MIKVLFYNTVEITDSLFKFAVIAARYNGDEGCRGKWIFCRHRERETWEIPGGHREPGEDIADTARRELYEETGALAFDIKPVCAYSVSGARGASYGMLFFAEVKALSKLPPDPKIGEIVFSDTLPKSLTYPEIQPQLFERVQGWLNLQSSADELWDVYDENRKPTGRVHRRGDPMPKGDYHLVVNIWLQNSRGEYLMTKRAPNKGYPNMWECTGGSALAGDDSLTTALREVREETGISLFAENGKRIFSFKREDDFKDVWLFKQDFDLCDVVLQPGETCGAMWASPERIKAMRDEGLLLPFSYLDELLESESNDGGRNQKRV